MKSNRSIVVLTVFSILSATFSLSLNAWAMEEGGRVGEPERSDRAEERPSVLHEKTEQATRMAEERSVTQALNMPRETVVKVLKEFNGNQTESRALRGLLKKAGKGELSTVELTALRSYIRLLDSVPGNDFHLKPSELQNRLTNWSAPAKAKFTQVLERAQSLALQAKAVSREEAFNLALKEEKLDQKYEQRCRKI